MAHGVLDVVFHVQAVRQNLDMSVRNWYINVFRSTVKNIIIMFHIQWMLDLVNCMTSCVRLREEEPLTAFPMSLTWASHIAASMCMGC